ncbi:MAG: hypothetical protein CMD26_00865 [Flavobacteriales bacterium]|nr:hypothetical protein [Flavobacteriales bacterium]|tara:strand:- start:142 stop:1506 length:1365 start_codon:yes stop_codon:yes gene_type:complete
MKRQDFLWICLLINCLLFGQQNNLELLFQWTDDGTVLNVESDPGDNWVGNIYNEIWGFVQNDHEFAVIGSTQGTHIFDVTDPANSYLVASINGASTSSDVVHRDFHTYNGFLYAVADEMNSSTLQIIDINNLPNSAAVVYDSNDMITRSHNIFIDEQNGIMYSCGGKINGNANYLSLISLEDPQNPVFLTDYNAHGYVHDIYVINNVGYLNAANNGLHIVDFSDYSNPQTLGSLTEYPYQGYNHSGWLTEDGNTYVLADENHGYKMKVCDVSNPSEINVVSTILSDVSENSIPHNLIIKDNLLYVSHYYDGLWIWDITNPANPSYVASYDTYPLENGNSYKGAWGVYPLLPSGNILVSDMQYGLFVLAPPAESNTYISDNSNKEILFPNPCKDFIQIQTQNEFHKIDIYDIWGKLIISECPNSNNYTLDISNISNGIYFLSINNKKEQHRIIKH